MTVNLEIPEEMEGRSIERSVTVHLRDDEEPFTFRVQARMAGLVQSLPKDSQINE